MLVEHEVVAGRLTPDVVDPDPFDLRRRAGCGEDLGDQAAEPP